MTTTQNTSVKRNIRTIKRNIVKINGKLATGATGWKREQLLMELSMEREALAALTAESITYAGRMVSL